MFLPWSSEAEDRFGGGGGAYEVASTPTPPHWTQPATATAGLAGALATNPSGPCLIQWVESWNRKKSDFQEEYENDMNVYEKRKQMEPNKTKSKNLFFEYSIFRLHAQVCFCVKSVCLRLGFCMSLVRQKQPRIVQFKRLETSQARL